MKWGEHRQKWVKDTRTLRCQIIIFFISSKIKRNIYYFNQPWYFFFDTATAAATAADADAAAADAAAV